MSSTDKDRGLGKAFKSTLRKMLRDSPSPPPASHSAPEDLIQNFHALAVSDAHPDNGANRYTDQRPPPGFVGGFSHQLSQSSDETATHLQSHSRPPAMPAPFSNSYGNAAQQQSLTMQHALNPNSGLLSPKYAYSGLKTRPNPHINGYGMSSDSNIPSSSHARPQQQYYPPPRPHSASALPPPAAFMAAPAHSFSPEASDLLDNKPLPMAPAKRPNPQPDQKTQTPSAPVKKHQRASSVSPPGTGANSSISVGGKSRSYTGKNGTTVQCAGITKANKRCTRQVKVSAALLGDPSSSSDPSVPNPQAKQNKNSDSSSGASAAQDRFCHQHQKELLTPSGFYARSNGTWVDFDDWIPGYLSQETQVALRLEMERSKSAGDVKGFVYAFEIRDPTTPLTIKLKVGRAVNLVRRMDQWGKQCGSKEQVLRGWYPGGVEDDDNGDNGDPSLMRGRVRPGPPGPWCHRLERLVHLELGELAVRAAYLVPGWPNIQHDDVSTFDFKGAGYTLVSDADDGPCKDCGQTHKEIFSFTRARKGRYRGHEWDLVAQPVIDKWGAFVEAFV